MDTKRVKDVMIPLSDYAVVSQDSTVLDAIMILEASQHKLPSGKLPHRAVLAVDENNKVVGKIGQFALLKALEPKHAILSDLKAVSRPGISSESLTAMMEHFQLFEDNLSDLCHAASKLQVKNVMRTDTEVIDENASLGEAIHKFVVWQTLSLLVARGTEVIGILRLSDLFDEITRHMKAIAASET